MWGTPPGAATACTTCELRRAGGAGCISWVRQSACLIQCMGLHRLHQCKAPAVAPQRVRPSAPQLRADPLPPPPSLPQLLQHLAESASEGCGAAVRRERVLPLLSSGRLPVGRRLCSKCRRPPVQQVVAPAGRQNGPHRVHTKAACGTPLLCRERACLARFVRAQPGHGPSCCWILTLDAKSVPSARSELSFNPLLHFSTQTPFSSLCPLIFLPPPEFFVGLFNLHSVSMPTRFRK